MSSNSTTYTVFVNGTEGESRSRKGKAVEQAEIALANDASATVEVRTGTGTVVWPAPEVEVTEAPAEVTASTRTKPFTRTEDPNFEIEAPEGYEAAYTRARVSAVVFRKVGEKGDYLVLQVNGEGEVILTEAAVNTTEAREITNRLADEHRVAQEAAKVAKAAEKAAAKEAKDAEKAAAREVKEAEAAASAEAEELVSA